MKTKKVIKIAIALVLILVITIFAYSKLVLKTSSTTQYKTSLAEKGTLINSVSASGTITSGNITSITTGATGTVKKVYVKNGDTVKKGQKIADLVLDDEGGETQTTAWANYLTALENVKTAQASRLSADVQMWKDRQAVLDAQTEYDNMIAGAWNPKTKAEYTYNEKAVVTKTLELTKLTFTADETKFNNSGVDISLAKAKLEAALRSYQQVSRTILAPASGVLSNLTLAEGVVISDSSGSSITVSTGTDSTTNSVSVNSQKIGAIKDPSGRYQATLNLTQVDVPKIKSGQKVVITMDAFPETTLTGTVLAVNTSGSVSSNVTTYPVSVLLDPTDLEIYTNMAVAATIITATKGDVVMIPSTAIKNNTVQILKNDQPISVAVETGLKNDTQTEIVSGINEGDVVITSTTSTTKTSNSSSSTSVFGNTRGFGGMGR